MGKLLMGAGSVAKPATSSATGGYAESAGTLDSSGWTVNIGGTAPGLQLASGGMPWLLLAVAGAAAVVLWRKKS